MRESIATRLSIDRLFHGARQTQALHALSQLLLSWSLPGSSESRHPKRIDQNQDQRSAEKRRGAARNVLSLSLSRFFPLFALLARPRKASKPQKPPKKRKTKNSPAPRSALSSPSRATRSPCTTRGRSRMAPSSTRRSTGEKGRKKEREGERGGERERRKACVHFLGFLSLIFLYLSHSLFTKNQTKRRRNSGDPFVFTLGAGQVIKGKKKKREED